MKTWEKGSGKGEEQKAAGSGFVLAVRFFGLAFQRRRKIVASTREGRKGKMHATHLFENA